MWISKIYKGTVNYTQLSTEAVLNLHFTCLWTQKIISGNAWDHKLLLVWCWCTHGSYSQIWRRIHISPVEFLVALSPTWIINSLYVHFTIIKIQEKSKNQHISVTSGITLIKSGDFLLSLIVGVSLLLFPSFSVSSFGTISTQAPTWRGKKKLKATSKWKQKAFLCPFSLAALSLKSNLTSLRWQCWHFKPFTESSDSFCFLFKLSTLSDIPDFFFLVCFFWLDG